MTRRPKSLRLVSLAALLPLVVFVTSFVADDRARQTSTGEEVVAFVGATVVDGTGAEAYAATVVVRGTRIAAVGRDVDIPPGARVIRAEGHTLLPGLFDLHTHLPYATAPDVVADWPKNLKAYLYSGVTSVVDFGTYPETFEPMRRLISTGQVQSPRIHFAARLTTPGGHGAEGGRGDFFTLEVQTPREARAAVRRLLPYKPDVLKVFTDGWRYGTAPEMSSMNEETLAALCEEAHAHGLKVLTHTVTLERAKQAARAGVDVLAHGVGDREADDELALLLKTKGTTYVSTLAVYEPRGRDILSPLLSAVLEPLVRASIEPPLTAPRAEDLPAGPNAVIPSTPAETGSPNERTNETNARRDSTPRPSQRELRARRWRNLLHNVSALRRAGASLGAGTDAGVTGTHHGWASLRELELLVQGGLT
ncbi:MAG TPA: amidohydrolase family protein, partial [Pyrinomonadaceae bacterium]|nr:amidohydrolase family protein [Pyrinomonadaceae bacterium]